MTDAFYANPVWTCGVCGCRGPWMLTLRWFDASLRWEVPGGQTQWGPMDEPRRAIGCSMECGRKFAKAVGRFRISIHRPQFEDRQREDSIEFVARVPRRRAA